MGGGGQPVEARLLTAILWLSVQQGSFTRRTRSEMLVAECIPAGRSATASGLDDVGKYLRTDSRLS